jgi:hypothetical protein
MAIMAIMAILAILAFMAILAIFSLLAHDAHVVPVILEFLATIQADHVMVSHGSRHVPVRINRAADRGSGRKGLRNLFVRTTNGKELENLIYHEPLLDYSIAPVARTGRMLKEKHSSKENGGVSPLETPSKLATRRYSP